MACLCGGLARVDARRLRLYDIPDDHGADRAGVQRPAGRGNVRLYGDSVAAAARRNGVGLDGGPDGTQGAADDLDPVVFDLQLYRRLFADLLVSVPVPRPARHRHGGRMAGRRRPGDGILADTVARLYERRTARIVGARFSAVECGLWSAV